MTGLRFLALLFALLGVCAGLGLLVRVAYRPPGDDRGPMSLGLYQIAFLAGGLRSVAEAAITALYAAGLLHLEEQLLVGQGTLAPGSHPVEAAIFVRASRSELARSPRRRQLGLAGAFSSDLELAVRAHAGTLEQELRDLGLILSRRHMRTMRLMIGPIMLVPVLLGIGGFLWSLVAGRPKGYLVVPPFMSLVIGSLIVLPEGRTRRGDRVLARIRSDNAALETAPTMYLSPSQLALGVALWGPRILEASPLAQLGRILRLARAADVSA